MFLEDVMLVTVNGKSSKIEKGTSLGELLLRLQIKRERVATEVNMDIVPRAEYDSRILTDGDIIEIVQFVGGG